eukprot:4592445-Alexandrium_andersonii.AAC.1
MVPGAASAEVVVLAPGDDAKPGLELAADSGEPGFLDQRRRPEPAVLELGREYVRSPGGSRRDLQC